MAYELYYTAHFSNEQSQNCEVYIYKKDAAPPAEVENFEIPEDEARCVINDASEGQSKYECIITRELSLSLFATEGNSLTWETFISPEYDTWKIELLIDGQYYFQGFITSDEGNAPFQDKPYNVNIKATNGLSLLKGVSLSDTEGDEFDGDHPLIDYIAGALKKTGLNINIRIYCGYFHLSMLNKGNSLFTDLFQQTELNYRTFMKDATTFVSCYEALMIILDRFCTVEYWNGMWMIFNIAEKQYIPVKRYYVDYSSSGSSIGGGMDTNNYGQIGKSVDIYPINEMQNISSKFGVKSVTTRFEYNIWPEIPRNNKFERGTEFETGDAEDVDDIDGDGDTSEIIGTYKKFTIDNWELGTVDLNSGPDFPLGPPTGDAYRRSVYNNFNVEIDRAIVIETPTTGIHWLRSEGIPVTWGSKIKISLQKKFTADFTGGSDQFSQVARVYLVPIGSATDYYALYNDKAGVATGTGRWKLESGTPPDALIIDYVEDQDSRKYASLNVESLAIPANGTLYFAFNCSASGTVGPEQWYKDFVLEYLPFAAGGYIPVKGDYIKRTQSANFPDVIDDEVNISDSLHRVVKGALIFNDQLTDAAWYRYGDHTIGDANPLGDAFQFKELLNIGRYNHAYRKMFALEGDFNGLNWAPENDQLNKMPIGFFWMYREVDMGSVRDFVFTPPLKMDIIKGWISGRLAEVFNNSQDGTRVETVEYKYQF